MDPRRATATRPQSRYPFPNQLSAATCLPALWQTTVRRARGGGLGGAPTWARALRGRVPHPVLASSPQQSGVVLPLSSGLPTPPAPPSHTTSAFHLANLQASGQGQDTRDAPFAQHKLPRPRPVPHPSHSRVQPPPAQCYSQTFQFV